MHNNILIAPEARYLLRGQHVKSNRLAGMFKVIGYTNNTADATVFIQDVYDTAFLLTYDVPENTLRPQ